MPLLTDQYQGPWWSISGQASSLVPYFRRRPNRPNYRRQRIDTPDGDFIDVDLLAYGHPRVVIISHGLEGSSDSQYMRSAAHLFAANSFDVIALNHRSCSGTLNKTTTMYHSGFTDDLHLITSRAATIYDEIYLLGYSLGGNQVCRYLCTQQDTLPSAVIAGVAVSVPTDLADSARELARWHNYMYTLGFLRTLRDKALLKAEQHPDSLDVAAIKRISTLKGFDDIVTAPLHGFADADDYYEQCSSLSYLAQAQRPLLMINALDDPFLGTKCYPADIARRSAHFHLLQSALGGHVGYMQKRSDWTYAEQEAVRFCTLQS